MAATSDMNIDIVIAGGGRPNEIMGVAARVEELTLEQNTEQDEDEPVSNDAPPPTSAGKNQ